MRVGTCVTTGPTSSVPEGPHTAIGAGSETCRGLCAAWPSELLMLKLGAAAPRAGQLREPWWDCCSLGFAC